MRNGGSGRLRSAFRLSLLRSWILLSFLAITYPFFSSFRSLKIGVRYPRRVADPKPSYVTTRKPLFLLKTPKQKL